MGFSRESDAPAPPRAAVPDGDPQERVRVEIASWFARAQRDQVLQRLRTAALPVPEALQCEVQIVVVRRTAGALDLLDAVLADAARHWRAWLSA